MSDPWLRLAASMYGAAWEARRRSYALGWRRGARAAARVISVGNLTVGGTGKTTLVMHLAARLAAGGEAFTVVCRRYRPGPGGTGDEEQLYTNAFGAARVRAGRSKRDLAIDAARAGSGWILVDDGFSHWGLERDLDLVLLDAQDLWGGEALLPAGRLREPRRALQRADAVVVSRLGPGEDPAPHLAAARRHAPAAVVAAGRHRIAGVRSLGGESPPRSGRAWVVTATGNPAAVERSAEEAGFEIAGRTRYRDHHWFRTPEVERVLGRARAEQAIVLTTAKDEVRWPASARSGVFVLDVEWQWVCGGDRIAGLMEGLR